MNLRELCMIILLKTFKSLVIPTGKTTDHMAFKFFQILSFIKSGPV